MEIPTGIIADKIGRKYSLLVTSGLYIIGNMVIIYTQTYWLFVLVHLMFGIAIAFKSGSEEALVYDSLKHQKKEHLMTKIWGSINQYPLIAGVIAATIGGFIAKDLNPEAFVFLIWLYVIASAIAFVISFFIKEERHEKDITRKNPFLIFKESSLHLFKNQRLRRIVYLSVLTISFTHILMFLFQPYFSMANVGGIWFGIAMSAGLILGALSMRYAYKIEEIFGMKTTIFIATILPGILYILMAIFVGPIISVLLFILLKGTMNLKNPLFSKYQNLHIQSYNRATVLSIISMITSLYLVIMRFVIGTIANSQLLLSFAIMGCIIIFGAIFLRIDEKELTV